MREFISSSTSSQSDENDDVDAAVMFAELVGVGNMTETRGTDKAEVFLARCMTGLKTAVEHRGGVVIQANGVDLLAHFPSADAALEAATEIQLNNRDGQVTGGHEFTVRIGVAYGQVTIQADDVHGEAVQTAAEMCGAAKPNQIVATIRLHDTSSQKWQAKARTFPYEHNGIMGGFAVCEILWNLG